MELYKMPYKFFAKKLSGSADQKDELEFKNLVQNDDHALIEYRLLQKIWEEAAHIKPFESFDTCEDWKTISEKLEDKKFRMHHNHMHWSTYFIRIAAILILSGGLSAAFYKFLIIPQNRSGDFTVCSAPDIKKDIILPDGSLVTLNKGSRLTYRDDFGKATRDVILEGEAFFSVVPGASLPFRVYSNESVVEVTGTQFSVYERNGQIHVAVITGTVQLSSLKIASNKVSISANHSGYIMSGNTVKVEEGIPDNDLSWKTGILSFDQTPLDSALLDIANHFNRELVVVDSLNEEITAEFHDQPLHEILGEIKLVAGLKFDTTGNALIVRK